MKNKITKIMIILLITVSSHSWVQAGNIEVGTQFTYQGELIDNGSPANGEYDLLFHLYGSNVGGAVIDFVNIHDEMVNNGLISVELDFGDLPFDGDERFLAVSVRPGNSDIAYEPLDPRQRINVTPYAIQAEFVENSGQTSLWTEEAEGISYSGGNVGIGTAPSSMVALYVDSDVNDDPVRFRVDGSTKMRVHNNGGTSLGISTEAPENGLLVGGKVLQTFGSHGFLKAATSIECGSGLNGGSISFFNNVNDNDFVTTQNGAGGGCSITVPFSITNAFFTVSAHDIGGVNVFETMIASCSATTSTTIQCQLQKVAGGTASVNNGVVQLAIY